jgi:membrane protease YdiL (CAAX protease family)
MAYAAILSLAPARCRLAPWLRPGRFGREEIVAAFLFVVISSLALSVWYFLAEPDMELYVGSLPQMPLWLFPFAGLGFALTNAAMEEAAFRGIIMQALDSAFGRGAASLVTQAVLFGLMHYLEGFPNGVWGVVMASVFGLMMGLLRRGADGMLAPWAAHALTDLTIFIIVAVYSLRS